MQIVTLYFLPDTALIAALNVAALRGARTAAKRPVQLRLPSRWLHGTIQGHARWSYSLTCKMHDRMETEMKTKLLVVLLAALGAGFFTGCVAIPPLIQVQHKDAEPSIGKRLDSIEKRLERIEEKSDKKP